MERSTQKAAETSNQNVEDTLPLILCILQLTLPVTVSDPILVNVKALVFQRDGPDFAMRRNPNHVPGSNVEPGYVIPPSLLRGLEVVKEVRCPWCSLLLLEAFLPSGAASGLVHLLGSNPDDTFLHLRNVLLPPLSIHRAFRAGHMDIRTRSEMTGGPPPGFENYGMRNLYPEPVPGLYLGNSTPFNRPIDFFGLSILDAEKLPLPSSFLISMHFRFATVLHMFHIEDKVPRGWPSRLQSRRSSCPALFRIWRILPVRVRLYPLEADDWAQRLPNPNPKNEPNVLELVQKHTSILAPRLLDTWESDGVTNVLMTRVPGVPLGEACHLMSDAERDQFGKDLRDCVDQLRKIPSNTPYLMCDSLSGPIIDRRIPDEKWGPLNTEAGFNDRLTSHLDVLFSGIVKNTSLLARDHGHSYFTHSDFHPTNLLEERSRLSGIVDWESAGFRPEYWEFTKAVYEIYANAVLRDIFWRAVWRQYETKLEVERRLWALTLFGC
ncbi:kinase-like domain-containing protein [Aspergillus falconensis]